MCDVMVLQIRKHWRKIHIHIIVLYLSVSPIHQIFVTWTRSQFLLLSPYRLMEEVRDEVCIIYVFDRWFVSVWAEKCSRPFVYDLKQYATWPIDERNATVKYTNNNNYSKKNHHRVFRNNTLRLKGNKSHTHSKTCSHFLALALSRMQRTIQLAYQNYFMLRNTSRSVHHICYTMVHVRMCALGSVSYGRYRRLAFAKRVNMLHTHITVSHKPGRQAECL